MQIQNTTALVTGGASGLGLATAEHLARLGAKVAVIDRAIKTDNPAVQQFLCMSADVTDDNQIAEAIEIISSQLGPARIIVNCAGIAPARKVVNKAGVMPLGDFEQVIRINLIGTFNVIRLAVEKIQKLDPLKDPLNQDGERGVIINTASIAATDGQIGQAAYAASKAGIQGLTLPLAREFAPFGIRVMTIAPGIFTTPMMKAMPDEVQTALANTIPYPKRLGNPAEYAHLAQHIIENRMLNGEIIRLDGALRMQAQ